MNLVSCQQTGKNRTPQTERFMDKIYGFFDKVLAPLGGEQAYLLAFYKVFIVVGGAFILWFILKSILGFIEKREKKYEFVKIHPQIYIIVQKMVRYALMLATGAYLIRIFNARLIENIFYATFIIFFAAPVKEFLIITLVYLEKNIAQKTETKIDNIIFDLFNKFAGVITFSVAAILALDMLGVNVMPFVAGAGVAGIAIGFAAKDTLSNLIAGVLLIIDRPFEVGDRIEVWSAPKGSSTWGDVIDIGLRATKIQTTDNLVIIIPNNEIMKRDIVNYTIISSKIRVRINIGVAYDTPIDKAKTIILQVAKGAGWIAKEPPPKVVVRNFGESSVDLQLRVWIEDARKRMDTISYITDQVKEAFDLAGVKIPFPKRDITIVDRSKGADSI